MLVTLLAVLALALPARADDDAHDSVELIVPAPRPWSVRVELLRLERGRWSWPGSELLRPAEPGPDRVPLPPLRSQAPLLPTSDRTITGARHPAEGPQP